MTKNNININVLKLDKIYPKIEDFHFYKYQFYIYVYLNPFKPLKKPLVMKSIKGKEEKTYLSAYEPLYVGKASSGGGYRHNQHIHKYQIGQETNILKIKAFQELEKNFEKARKENSFHLPHNWKEYQSNWIIILETFNDPKELLKFEVTLIKNIGTKYSKTGPLVNKIENAFTI